MAGLFHTRIYYVIDVNIKDRYGSDGVSETAVGSPVRERQIQLSGDERVGMYSVVGCRDCHALWIVEGRPETTECPRCQRRHQFGKLRTFAETDSSEAATRVRSSMLAERADDGDFVDPESIDVDAVGIDDDEFLSASGIDSEAVSAAGNRSERGQPSRSRKQVVLDGLTELEAPTEQDVLEYANAAGVPESYAERTLEKLRLAGEVTRSEGVYRRL